MTAVLQQLLAELTISDSLHSYLLVAFQVDFQTNDLFAKISVESAVLLFVLGLSENGLYHNLQVLLHRSVLLLTFFLCLFSQDINVSVKALFIGKLTVTEHETTELLEFLIEVIWKNDVNDKTNLLMGVFVRLGLLNDSFALFEEFLSQIVGL